MTWSLYQKFMNKLNNGVVQIKYSRKEFPFDKLLFNELSKFSNKRNNFKVKKLDLIHKNKEILDNLETYRQCCFALFRSEKFQKIYKKFGIYLIKKYFNKNSLLQKTPTIRIQLPGRKITPYHTDRWYGHGKTVRTIWLPITNVNKNNTMYIAKNEKLSEDLIKKIEKQRPKYSIISKEARLICNPIIGGMGDLFVFKSNMFHGTEVSKNGKTRISFDFRIAKSEDDLGIKSKSNFYSLKELNIKNKIKKIRNGLFYTNKCKGLSAKHQILQCKIYCEENNINIMGGDSEILPLSYLPVLKNYIEEKELKINCIVVYGLDIFNSNKKIAKEILELLKKNKKDMIFCNENIIFDKKYNFNNIMKYI